MSKLSLILKKILLVDRIKAFIVDVFMIYTPILYIVTYGILGSKNEFINNDIAIFVCFSLYCIIISFMFYKKSQTLGYRYSSIILLRENNSNVGFLLSLLRVLLFCISMSLLFGFLFPFLSRDNKTFHDFFCKTKVIKS